MKLIFTLNVCLSLLGLFSMVQADKAQEFVFNIAKKCITDTVTEKDIEAIMENSTPTHEGKCFIACTMKELQLINEDGKFNSDGVVKLSEQVHGENYNSDDATKLSEAIAEKCTNYEGEDECDTAFNLYRCGKAEYDAARQ